MVFLIQRYFAFHQVEVVVAISYFAIFSAVDFERGIGLWLSIWVSLILRRSPYIDREHVLFLSTTSNIHFVEIVVPYKFKVFDDSNDPVLG